MRFKIICPKCNSNADVMSYVRKTKKRVEVNYICPYCGHGDSEENYLYE